MSYDSDLATTAEGRTQLARQLADELNKDNSQPMPTRDDWKGEKTLRDLEEALIQGQNLYGQFAHICEIAYGFAANSAVQALFLLGQINGLRRLTKNRPDQEIAKILDSAEKTINVVKLSLPRKRRLLELLNYHGGLAARQMGNFLSAASLNEKSAELAEEEGDLVSAAISHFAASTDRFNYALTENRDISQAFADMQKAGDWLCCLLKDRTDQEALRWKLFNVPMHLIVDGFLAENYSFHDCSIEKINLLRSSYPQLFKAGEAAIRLAEAINFYCIDGRRMADIEAAKIIQEEYGKLPDSTYLAVAHLLRARIAQDKCQRHLRNASEAGSRQTSALANRQLLRLS